jgi:CheY-like chemotaxis protein
MEHPRKKVLIVDENADDLFFARQVLGDEGYEVLTHQSPFGITGLIETSEPNMVLLGSDMQAFPSEDLAAHLRADERTRHVPVVLYTSGDDARTSDAQIVKYRLTGSICKKSAAELRMKIPFFLKDHLEDPSAYRKRLYAVE